MLYACLLDSRMFLACAVAYVQRSCVLACILNILFLANVKVAKQNCKNLGSNSSRTLPSLTCGAPGVQQAHLPRQRGITIDHHVSAAVWELGLLKIGTIVSAARGEHLVCSPRAVLADGRPHTWGHGAYHESLVPPGNLGGIKIAFLRDRRGGEGAARTACHCSWQDTNTNAG